MHDGSDESNVAASFLNLMHLHQNVSVTIS